MCRHMRSAGASRPVSRSKRQPAPVVVEVGLIGEERRSCRSCRGPPSARTPRRGLTSRIARIARIDARHCSSTARDEILLRADMGIPEPVERTEPRRRQRLIDRRVGRDPGIALCDGAGIGREALREMRDRAGWCRGGPLPWCTSPTMGRIPSSRALREARVGPAPVGSLQAFGGGPLPEHRKTERAQPEAGEAIEIVLARDRARSSPTGRGTRRLSGSRCIRPHPRARAVPIELGASCGLPASAPCDESCRPS